MQKNTELRVSKDNFVRENGVQLVNTPFVSGDTLGLVVNFGQVSYLFSLDFSFVTNLENILSFCVLSKALEGFPVTFINKNAGCRNSRGCQCD